jgi:hypothetical protein
LTACQNLSVWVMERDDSSWQQSSGIDRFRHF